MASMQQSSHERQDYETPPDFMVGIRAEFGEFDVDVAATEANKKAARCWTPCDDGLSQDWTGLRCWMNPPYGRGIGAWVCKAATGGAEIVVALLPARTDTRWFHDYIWGKAEVRFLRGRVAFWLDGQPTGQPGKFPSMLVIWKPRPVGGVPPFADEQTGPTGGPLAPEKGGWIGTPGRLAAIARAKTPPCYSIAGGNCMNTAPTPDTANEPHAKTDSATDLACPCWDHRFGCEEEDLAMSPGHVVAVFLDQKWKRNWNQVRLGRLATWRLARVARRLASVKRHPTRPWLACAGTPGEI